MLAIVDGPSDAVVTFASELQHRAPAHLVLFSFTRKKPDKALTSGGSPRLTSSGDASSGLVLQRCATAGTPHLEVACQPRATPEELFDLVQETVRRLRIDLMIVDGSLSASVTRQTRMHALVENLLVRSSVPVLAVPPISSKGRPFQRDAHDVRLHRSAARSTPAGG
jgi:hypothetical protein